MKIKTKLIHLTITLFGDKELKEKGKVIPCKKCNKLFKSYEHYGEWSYIYDSICEDCSKKLNNMQEQRNVINCLRVKK